MPPPDHYAVLRVSPSAQLDEIKKAFRVLALKSHPDKRGGSEEAFKRVNAAYETLSDPFRRALYDATRPLSRADRSQRARAARAAQQAAEDAACPPASATPPPPPQPHRSQRSGPRGADEVHACLLYTSPSPRDS